MTVIERPLLGKVRIFTDEWQETRRNEAINPRAVNLAPGFNSNDGSKWTVAKGYPSPFGGPPGLGIGTCARVVAVDSSSPTAASVNSIDGLANSSTPRRVGTWILPAAAGFTATLGNGAPMPLTSGKWNWIESGAPNTGYVAANLVVSRATGNAGNPCYVTGVRAVFDGAPLAPAFHGSTAPADIETQYFWIGTVNASASVEEKLVELTPDATGISFRRGGARDGLGVKTDVGLCSFNLKNAQDPLDGGSLVPGQTIRIVGQAGELFTGRIADVASAYPVNKATGRTRAVVTVTVADAVKVHALTPRYGVQIAAGFETFESRISRLGTSAQAPVEAPTVGAPREVYAF